MLSYRNAIFSLFKFYVILYLFIIGLNSVLPDNIQKYGLFNNELNLKTLLEEKALYTSNKMTESNLGLNFLANKNKLSNLEYEVFQNSGLLHLLAISGGQINPLTSLSSFIISNLVFILLIRNKTPQKSMLINANTNKIINFIIALFISLIFGATGALTRTAFLTYLKKMNIFKKAENVLFSINPNFCPTVINKILIILILSILFGNVFLNYSFLLSAIGASCAEICAFFCNLYLRNKNEFFLNSIIKSSFFVEISITLSTCMLVGVILSPLTPNNIFDSCLANMFAIPVVTFVVTPCALLTLLFPIDSFLYNLSMQGLDFSLVCFKHIALSFSHIDIPIFSKQKNTILFSDDGLFYLNFILIILWIIIDLVKQRKIINLRVEYKLSKLNQI